MSEAPPPPEGPPPPPVDPETPTDEQPDTPRAPRWWLVPLIAFGVLVAVCVAVWWFFGLKPVAFGLAFTAVGSVAVWFSITVYYSYILEVSREPDEPQPTVRVYAVPIELREQVRIKGASATARDGSGRPLMVVSHFDPDTLTGHSDWPAGMTYIDFLARFNLIDEVLKRIKTTILQYGEAAYKAQADYLKAWDTIALQGEQILKLKKALAIWEKSRYGTKSKRSGP